MSASTSDSAFKFKSGISSTFGKTANNRQQPPPLPLYQSLPRRNSFASAEAVPLTFRDDDSYPEQNNNYPAPRVIPLPQTQYRTQTPTPTRNSGSNMGCSRVAPILFQVIACLFLIAAICLTLAGVLTHSWQNFTFSDSEKREVHAHGLWMDCIEEEFFRAGSKHSTCWYKFHEEDKQGHHQGHDHSHDHGHSHGSQNQQRPHQHEHKILPLPSRQTILALLCVAAGLGLIGLLFSFCAPCLKWCSIIWAVFSLISTVLSLAGIIVFFVNSHDFERNYQSGSAQTIQAHGYSFYCGVVGCAMFLFATILAILTTVLLFAINRREDYADKNVNKTWPKIYTHNTAV